MGKARVVLDTNLFISILLRSPALSFLADFIRSGKAQLIISPAQIAELVEVLHHPKFNFAPTEIKDLLDWIGTEATLVIPKKTSQPISRDPKDDFILTSALAGNAEAIITGDKDLLALSSYEGIPILSPAKFAATLS